MRERQPFGGPLLVSFADGRSEQAIGGRLARAMRVQVDDPAAASARAAKRERITDEAASARRERVSDGDADREEVSA